MKITRVGDKAHLEGHCPFGHSWELTVSVLGLERWVSGEIVQRAFPELSSDERELLITGICKDHWGKLFGDENPD